MIRELLVGAHMSIAGGIYRAFERGGEAGCRTIQIFLKNSNRWQGRRLSLEDRELYLDAQAGTGIHPVVAHSSYLINLASPDRVLYEKSLAAFVDEMHRADFLGLSSVILHPGAHMGQGEKQGVARVADALNRAMDQVGPPLRVLLENTAGQGTCLGHSFEQLALILERVRHSDRVGICLDTCHAFAAGYDIRTEDGYERTLHEFDRLLGIKLIGAIHTNDCLKGLGCHIDRHTHIGKGFIGSEAFRCLVNDGRFDHVPKILETPKGEDLKLDRRNLATLRRLVGK